MDNQKTGDDQAVKVVALTDSRPSLAPKSHDSGRCQHVHILVDEKTRMLECKACGQMIEPFDYIWKEAVGQSRATQTLALLKRELTGLMAEKETLEKAIANLRAQKKRLSK